jgi:hypothetical protein
MADPTSTKAPAWEYRSILIALGRSRELARHETGEPLAALDDALNTQARDGWELVSVVPTLAAGENASGVAHVVAVFQRHPNG